MAKRAELNGRIVDSYANIENVKLFAGPDIEDDYIREGIIGLRATTAGMMRVNTAWPVSMVAWNAALFAAVFVVAVVLWRDGALPVGSVVVAVTLVNRLESAAYMFQNNANSVFSAVGQVSEGMKSLARPLPTATPTEIAEPAPTVAEVASISLNNVEFGYRPGEPVIRGVSLEVAEGQEVGIVGPSGGDKTTLIRLVAGLRVPDTGSIALNGREVRSIPEDRRRLLLGVVSQDAPIFNRSIRENVRYGRPVATDDEVWLALQRAQADGFVKAVTDSDGRKGLDAVVGERGSGISAGQRQRIAIARALIRDAPIMILDEASSALDSRTEEALQRELAHGSRAKRRMPSPVLAPSRQPPLRYRSSFLVQAVRVSRHLST